MVIANSDSCDTLVSLQNGLKQLRERTYRSSVEPPATEETFVQTQLFLPTDDCDYGDGHGDDHAHDWNNMPTSTLDVVAQRQDRSQYQNQKLYLPICKTLTNNNVTIDEHVRSIPEIMESANIFLANARTPRQFSSNSREKILYVAQGEVAHALASQCDVIVSDKATTCHILAFRSSSSTHTSLPPLTSLTHIDSDEYEDCIREIVQQHKAYHFQQQQQQLIEMDVHILGGFEDENASSRKISEFAMNLLARMAEEEQSLIRMTLQTCVISSMNDTGYSCPIGRGLGIHLSSGDAFLAKVHASATGPERTLRSVRLWSSQSQSSNGDKKLNHQRKKTLSLIHNFDTRSHLGGVLSVSPFFFQAFPEIDKLLEFSDDIMLQYTSTSPTVEDDDFCDCVRTAFQYMKNVRCTTVFGTLCDTPLAYGRVDGSCNEWQLLVL